ncbi:GntR family transcriptional regulator, partial [Pseudomonas sp. GP01-A3]
KRITYDQSKVIEYTISIARGDKFTYTVELN